MDKKLYFSPETEIVELSVKTMLLSGSLEDPEIGGSEQGHSTEPFNPGA